MARRKRRLVKVTWRKDAPNLEKRWPVSTTLFSDQLEALDAIAVTRKVTRSEAARDLLLAALTLATESTRAA